MLEPAIRFELIGGVSRTGVSVYKHIRGRGTRVITDSHEQQLQDRDNRCILLQLLDDFGIDLELHGLEEEPFSIG